MLVRNFTPHAVNFYDENGNLVKVLHSEGNARADNSPGELVEIIDGIPCYGPDIPGPVIDLPEPQENTILVVSLVVAQHPECKNRTDLRVPGTGPHDKTVREPQTLPDGSPNPKKGLIKGITRLKWV